jgi:hypothetical protein
MSFVHVEDGRLPSAFRTQTFSGFKTTEVRKALCQAWGEHEVDPACYWSLELLCSGQLALWWESVLGFFTKHIQLGHPTLVFYLDRRATQFKAWVHAHTGSELSLRNHPGIRRLLLEVNGVLCEARPMPCWAEVKVEASAFDWVSVTEKRRAPHTEYAELLPTDPPELFPVLNELAFWVHTEGHTAVHAWYWIEWMVTFEEKCRKRKDRIVCEARPWAPVEAKYQTHIVWLMWEVLQKEAVRRGKWMEQAVQASMRLFAFRFTPRCVRTRQRWLRFAGALLTEVYSRELPWMPESETVSKVWEKESLWIARIQANSVAEDPTKKKPSMLPCERQWEALHGPEEYPSARRNLD